MTEDQKKNLENQLFFIGLWGIANLFRGKISADDYRDYILGFIFFKYFSEEQQKFANLLSATDKKITTMDKQFTETESFKKGLLQRMFV